jgi:hypothetical protein
MIFRCEGTSLAGHLASENTFRIVVPAGKKMKVISVPNGTTNFTIAMSPEHVMQVFPAELFFRDPVSRLIISRKEMTHVDLPKGNQNEKWSVLFKTPEGKKPDR